MLRSVNSLLRLDVATSNGKAGAARDLYFDDQEWQSRFIVVNSGVWLPGKSVLVSPTSVDAIGDSGPLVQLHLTRAELRSSPGIETYQPVCRQEEQKLTKRHSWLPGWGTAVAALLGMRARGKNARQDGGPTTTSVKARLRSAVEVRGYDIRCGGDACGHIDDLLLDDTEWKVAELVVSTGNWLRGRRVRVSTNHVHALCWHERAAELVLNREQIRRAPRFVGTTALNGENAFEVTDDRLGPMFWF
ncbi:MAG: hypothetical protein JXO22_09705 [Phycisphaerae bacterium]|nr:hypothetical protein [Phycisphaerae bacterium]